MKLKYGMNPYQDYAELEGNKALKLLNGKPSMINLLDALNSWQLVKELDSALGKAAAASFKHVSPSGAAVAGELDDKELLACNYGKKPSGPLTEAYLRARSSDRLASFGDFVALSRKVDEDCASLIRSEVSDGIIAPAYDEAALEILKMKKGGSYLVFQLDPEWEPPAVESRDIFGFTVKQNRNNLKITSGLLDNTAAGKGPLPKKIADDLVLGMISLKYTQSNSVAVVYNGQTIGIGAGQQSRILCSELALSKANRWYQKTLLGYDFISRAEADGMKLKKTDKDLLIEEQREASFGSTVSLNKLDGLCLCSDAYFPQTDNIKLAALYGVSYIAAPMGSVKDADIIKVCEDYGITFINTGVRLFHH